MIGDIHLGWDDEAERKATAALDDARAIGGEVVVFLGDVVDMSEALWPLFTRLVKRLGDTPWVICRGNADFDAGGDDAWNRVIGRPVRDMLDHDDLRLLILGGESANHRLSVGDGVGEWIRARAEERPEALVIVVSHAPLKDTTFWSCNNTEDNCLGSVLGDDNPPYHLYLDQSAEVGAAIGALPNVRLFLTGHVHNDNRMTCDHGYGPWVERDGVIHLVTANIGGWTGLGVPRREYRVVDIDEETIAIRARDFLDARWVDDLELRFPRWQR